MRHGNKKLGLLLTFSILFLLSSGNGSPVHAGNAVLTWDANLEPDLAGYKIYYGTAPGSYGAPIEAGNQTTYTVTGLGYGTYYFAVRAYDPTGNLSGYSNEASRTFLDTTPPVISAINAGSITSASAAITWLTDEAATSLVEYGTTTAYGLSSALNSTLLTNHSTALSSLAASTLYHYRVKSTDASGNLGISGDNTFTSLSAPDTTAPTISGITVSNITSTGASVTWTTNEAADTQIQYGITTAYGTSTSLNTTLVLSHTQSLTGLLPSTLYNFSVRSRDAAGNLATSSNNTFTTSAAPDTTPPAISGLASSNITSGGATITWSTNEAATTQVDYGTTTAYGSSTTLNSNLTTGHTASLSGLTASATYHYRVKSADAAGNLATSGDHTFITAAPPDTTSPVISGVLSSNITSGGATITWGTNEAASSQVEYGTTTAYGSSSPLDTNLLASHSTDLGGLTASSFYHYRVKSADAAGNLATSGDHTFTTAAPPDTTPPALSGVIPSNITSGDATIAWSTNEAATTQVDYGTTTAYGSSTTLNSNLITSHTALLSGLTASATYHYRVKSADAAGNTAASPDNTFTTSALPDTAGPVLSLVAAANITTTGATISWGTDEPASTQVEYGLTPAYGNSTIANATLLNSHSQALTGFQASTPVHYRVKSADAAGNLSVSGDYTFNTGSVADTTPPDNIQDFTAKETGHQITLNWVNPPDLDFIGVRIRYRTDHYPSDTEDGVLLGDFTGQPNQDMSTIQTSIEKKATYYYSASSYDNSGNYQHTAYTSVTVTFSSDSSGSPIETTMSGGCGMVRPGSGKPSGPGQAADMITLLAVLLIAILKREIQKKKSFDSIRIISGIMASSLFFHKAFKSKEIPELRFAQFDRTVFDNKTLLFSRG